MNALSSTESRGTTLKSGAARWWNLAKRIKTQTAKDDVTLLAAGISFYLLLALAPGLAAAISLYGLFANPAEIQSQFEALRGLVPAEVQQTIVSEMERISSSRALVGIGAAVGILFALWSSSRGMSAMIRGLNVIYGVEEQRSFIRLTALSITFTIGAIILVIAAVGVIVVAPIVLSFVGLEGLAGVAVRWGRWIILLVLALGGLALLYRYGPNRTPVRPIWMSWGSILATVLWVAVSFLFSLSVSNFGNYNKTYGSMGAIVVLMMWLYLSSVVVLIGGELNSELEADSRNGVTRDPT